MEELDKSIVDNKGQITGILEQICNDNTLVRVNIHNINDTFSSAIIDITPNKKIFSLDELHPHDGHDAMKKGDTVLISTKNKGVETFFSAKIKDIAIKDDIYFYRMKYPKEISYIQRREAFRVPTTNSFSGNVSFSDPEGLTIRKIEGKLQDISATGFGGITLSDSLELNKEYECTLHFENDAPIKAIVKLVFLGNPGHRNQKRFGAIFVEFEKDRRRLQKLVTRIERDLIRRGSL